MKKLKMSSSLFVNKTDVGFSLCIAKIRKKMTILSKNMVHIYYSLSTLENTDENRIFFVRSPHHKHPVL